VALTTTAGAHTRRSASQTGQRCRRLAFEKGQVSRVEWQSRATKANCSILLWSSRRWEDIYQVRKKALSAKWISLTASNTSSLVIDQLCDQARNRDIAVSGLYCDYLAQEEQSAANMLGVILNQLSKRNGIPGPVRKVFSDGGGGFGRRTMQLSDLVEILKTTIASLPEVFICIDALDECLPKNRQELLEALKDIVRELPTTRVFLTGRPHIQDEMKRHFSEAITISITPTAVDIKNYLKMKLDQDPTPKEMNYSLRAEILEVISTKIPQMRVETICPN